MKDLVAFLDNCRKNIDDTGGIGSREHSSCVSCIIDSTSWSAAFSVRRDEDDDQLSKDHRALSCKNFCRFSGILLIRKEDEEEEDEDEEE